MPNWVYNTLTVSRKVWDDIKTPITEKHTDNFSPDKDGFTFDFNKIVPMPEALRDTESSTAEKRAVSYYLAKKHGTMDAEELFKKEEAIYKNLNPYTTVDSVKCDLDLAKKLFIDIDPEYKKYWGDTESSVLELGKRYVDLFEKYGHCDWYSWSIDNWGTKWNACDIDIDDSQDDVVYIYFNTAYDPPLPVYDKLAEMYPDEEISGYCEYDSGVDAFEWEVEDGKIFSWAAPIENEDD